MRRDLPLFRGHLRLDGVQHAMVGVLLVAYLDAFKLLMETSLPQDHFAPNGMGMNMILGDDPDGAGGEDIGTLIRAAVRNARGCTDIEIPREAAGHRATPRTLGGGDGGERGGRRGRPADRAGEGAEGGRPPTGRRRQSPAGRAGAGQ